MFELSYQVVEGSAASHWFVMTHGIFGQGKNWRTIAKKLVTQRPDIGIYLIDLREHGESLQSPAPHTLQSAADDVVRFARSRTDEQGMPRDISGLIGHSFGGKVCLLAGNELSLPVWLLDSSPSAHAERYTSQDNTVMKVLRVLENIGDASFPSRKEFVHVLDQQGLSEGVSTWLAMNLAPQGDELVLSFHPPALRSLLESYFQTDLSSFVRSVDHLVHAIRSDTIIPSDPALFSHYHPLDCGHWLHVEKPNELLALLASNL